jgi:ABC-type antimicrobial peptide transport system permease subunit
MNGRSELVAERAEVIAKRYDPSLNRESTRLLETRLEPSLRVPRLFAAMAGAFAWMAVLIGGFGVSSVVNQVTDRRRYETAVRVMCGATPADVLASYLRYVGTPATLGVMVGCYVGWVLGHQFVDEIDAGTRLSVSAVLVGTLTALVFVAAGVVVPSVRAAVREPLLMLKVK